MSKRSNHNCLEIGDVVRVRMANGKPGDTRYTLTSKDKVGFGCTLREIGRRGKVYAEQRFDTSLLVLEPNAEKTAKAMNASGFFRPFTVRAGKTGEDK